MFSQSKIVQANMIVSSKLQIIFFFYIFRDILKLLRDN